MEIKPYSDIFVKYLLGSKGNEDLLIDFINDVLTDSGFKEIKSVVVNNPFNHKDFPTDKLSVVDVRATDETGRIFEIEIQAQGNESHKHRVLFYWAEAYSSQLKEGDHYSKLKPVISINLLNFDLMRKYPEAHSLFWITKSDNPELMLTDHLYIHFLEIPKFLKEKDLSPLERWLFYFKHEGRDDMEIVIKDDPIIEKAHQEYIKFTQDDRLREIYRSQQRAKRDWDSDVEEARIEGKKEVAKEMLAEGLEIKLIEKVTKLSHGEIEKLSDEIKGKNS